MSKIRDNKNNNQGYYVNPYNILPAPAVLEEYESIHSGSVSKLLEMAKKEQEHRHSWQEEHLKVHNRIYKWGQIFAFSYNILLLALIAYLIDGGEHKLAIKLFTINASLMAFAVLVTFLERKVMNRRPPRRLPKKYSNNKKDGRDNKNRR